MPTPAPTPAVVTTLPYHIGVTCDYDTATDQTSCLFIGSGPEEASPIVAILLPTDVLCGAVVETDAELVDGSEGSVHRYRSTARDQESRPRCTIVFAGRVAPAESAIYWCETKDGTFPAEGDGLSCPQEASAEAISDSTGAVLVYPLRCPASDKSGDYDWYASCPPDPEARTFELRRVGEMVVSEALTAGSTGTEPARFLLLAPGGYALTEVGGDWCHAESDNISDEGELIVEAGKRTNVWVFHCPS
jgi:hypothetical protein